jgi:hypothetical protein
VDAGGEPIWTTSPRGHAGVTGLVTDPQGNGSDAIRMLRGRVTTSPAARLRVARRGGQSPGDVYDAGVRCARTVQQAMPPASA